jgi:hypothetical protein
MIPTKTNPKYPQILCLRYYTETLSRHTSSFFAFFGVGISGQFPFFLLQYAFPMHPTLIDMESFTLRIQLRGSWQMPR